jgi:feruloyl esterase
VKLTAAILISFATPAIAGTCESLTSLKLPQTTVTLAASVDEVTWPVRINGAPGEHPPFCRVAATLKPSDDSDIKIEVWMPTTAWNGNFEAVGNGGWSGSIGYAAMASAVKAGFAVASTDTGHEGSSASFALGHPEKLIDFAYRSEHEMTVKAKAIVEAFYGKAQTHAYWSGCSAGGKQALKEAQMYPDDFDGIVAGSPGAYWVGRATQAIWVAQAVHRTPESEIPAEKYKFIHEAVLKACDRLDGVEDGVIENPASCHFDPQTIACQSGDAPSCLTPPQVEAARKIYAWSIDSRTGQPLFPGLYPGSEMGWATWGGPRPLGIAYDYFRYVLFADPNWNFQSLNFGADIERARKQDGVRLDATDPNLAPFFAHGGKLIQYHGWGDPQISPGGSIEYYKAVQEKLGGQAKTRDSYRLFMVPGMAHCGGGDGTSTFDMVTPLRAWVETKKAPDRIEASRVRNGKTDRTRPLCPYPQTAVYKGSGSTDDAANFVCK